MKEALQNMPVHVISQESLNNNGHNGHNGNGHTGESLKNTVVVAPKPQAEPQPDKKPVIEPIAMITDIRFTVVGENGADNSYIKIVNDGTKQPPVEIKNPKKEMTDEEKKARQKQLLEPYVDKTLHGIFVDATRRTNAARREAKLPSIPLLGTRKRE